MLRLSRWPKVLHLVQAVSLEDGARKTLADPTGTIPEDRTQTDADRAGARPASIRVRP